MSGERLEPRLPASGSLPRLRAWLRLNPRKPAEEQSLVTFVVEAHHDIVRLRVTHERLADQTALGEISHGWPAVLVNLKSLLETGEVLPQAPWEMRPIH